MKRNSSFKMALMIFTLVFTLACSFGASEPTPTPAPTNTPVPTNTPMPTNTPVPTNTPMPTDTPLPPTPAPVGEAVSSSSFEVTVLEARSLSRVYMGSYYYYPKADQLFVEVVVKVTNLTGSPASIPWSNVYIVEATGDAWYPNWSGYKAAETGKKVDGASISVNDALDGTGTIDFNQDVFLRAIWFTAKQSGGTELLFGFVDSPNVVIFIP